MKSIELPTGPHDRPPGNHLHPPGNKPHPHPELLEASSASPRKSYQALEDTIKHQQQHTRKDLYTESKEQRAHSHFRGKMLTLAHGHNPKSQVAFGRHLPHQPEAGTLISPNLGQQVQSQREAGTPTIRFRKQDNRGAMATGGEGRACDFNRQQVCVHFR